MISQKRVWLAWPPPLLRTAARLSSGSASRLARTSSIELVRPLGSLERLVGVVDVGLVVLVVVDAASSARRCAARVRRTDKADPGLRTAFVSPSCSSFVPYDNINCVSAGRNLYVTAMEPESGKSVVALGLMELLAGRVERLGFFRPIVSATSPTRRSSSCARATTPRRPTRLTAAEAAAIEPYDELRKRVVEAYKAARAELRFRPLRGDGLHRRRAGPRLRAERRSRERAGRARARRRSRRRARADGGDRPRRAGRRCGRRAAPSSASSSTASPSTRWPPSAPRSTRRTSRSTSSPRTAELAYPTMADVADELGARVVRRRVARPRGTGRARRRHERRALHRASGRRRARDRPRRPFRHPRRHARFDGLARRSRRLPACC